ncbi:xylulokinase [Agrococcus sp. SGAir0287]|uniref:xylulokinase n=1 Tax=Agrococcus sp. SGAir0287 TaxID=2070347 RepID=UPI0010CCCEC2|nr:xylulokinase [Agrococcus sp. SGAir0287]QCR18196.1 xylulokinase [Agrococcus sp. SGAir0287]
MPIVAGVDTSTQSTTVELRDATSGVLLGSGRAPHPVTHPPVSEQDPRAWWAAFEVALVEATSAADVAPTEIRAIAVAGQCHGLVLLDDAGEPLRPAKLWNDTTSAPQAQRIVAELGGDAWARAVGSVPIPAFTITKLAWVAEHEPALLDRARHVLLPHDYMTWRLTGRAATDRSEASGTGYFAAHEGRYRTDLLDQFVGRRDWLPLLPEVLGPDEVVGTVRRDVSDRLGLAADVVVSVGGGDQHLGVVGLGLGIGEVAYSLGTSGVVIAVADAPVFDGSGVVTGVADATGGYLPLACTLNATKVTDWTARMLGVDVRALGDLALAADASDDRPVLAAFLDGERTPDRPDATGVLAGITTATTREQLARAAFEGVLLGLVAAHARIREVGAPCDGAVTVMGGGARSGAYRQLLADLLDAPVHVRDADESTARGAAIQAAAALHGRRVADLAAELRPATTQTIEPRARIADVVRDRYASVAAWTGADRRARRPSPTTPKEHAP